MRFSPPKRRPPGDSSRALATSGETYRPKAERINHLLPLPYTEETLAAVAGHIHEVQDVLGRRILIENPSSYLRFRYSPIPEPEFLAEGAMGDWSAVYLQDSLGTTPAGAATGFAAFSLAMAVGRLAGDRLAQRMGAARLLRLSGALAGGGPALSLLAGHTAVALLGFGLAGLGVANLIPILFSAAGRTPGIQAGTALAAVATTGYFGYLAGPPLIGFAAEAAGLPAALAIVCVACGLVAAGAAIIPPNRATLAPELHLTTDAITHTTEGSHA